MRKCNYCHHDYDEEHGDAKFCSYECYVFADLPPEDESDSGN
jgi:hypothetical protein